MHSLPDGYDTLIDDEGSNISAGEKQLLTIARAFLADPALLILDEATSSVDTRTEVLVQHAMAALRADRTSFVIAHRLSTIRDADLILVMQAGAIVEQGTHDELLASRRRLRRPVQRAVRRGSRRRARTARGTVRRRSRQGSATPQGAPPGSDLADCGSCIWRRTRTVIWTAPPGAVEVAAVNANEDVPLLHTGATGIASRPASRPTAPPTDWMTRYLHEHLRLLRAPAYGPAPTPHVHRR